MTLKKIDEELKKTMMFLHKTEKRLARLQARRDRLQVETYCLVNKGRL